MHMQDKNITYLKLVPVFFTILVHFNKLLLKLLGAGDKVMNFELIKLY